MRLKAPHLLTGPTNRGSGERTLEAREVVDDLIGSAHAQSIPARRPVVMVSSDEFRHVAEHTDEGLLVRWSGDCDVVARDLVASDPILAAVTSGQLVEVDLGAVTFMDSAGIHTLLELRQRVEQAGAEFVVRDASVPVRRVLELTGLMSVLEPDGAEPRV